MVPQASGHISAAVAEDLCHRVLRAVDESILKWQDEQKTIVRQMESLLKRSEASNLGESASSQSPMAPNRRKPSPKPRACTRVPKSTNSFSGMKQLFEDALISESEASDDGQRLPRHGERKVSYADQSSLTPTAGTRVKTDVRGKAGAPSRQTSGSSNESVQQAGKQDSDRFCGLIPGAPRHCAKAGADSLESTASPPSSPTGAMPEGSHMLPHCPVGPSDEHNNRGSSTPCEPVEEKDENAVKLDCPEGNWKRLISQASSRRVRPVTDLSLSLQELRRKQDEEMCTHVQPQLDLLGEAQAASNHDVIEEEFMLGGATTQLKCRKLRSVFHKCLTYAIEPAWSTRVSQGIPASFLLLLLAALTVYNTASRDDVSYACVARACLPGVLLCGLISVRVRGRRDRIKGPLCSSLVVHARRLGFYDAWCSASSWSLSILLAILALGIGGHILFSVRAWREMDEDAPEIPYAFFALQIGADVALACVALGLVHTFNGMELALEHYCIRFWVHCDTRRAVNEWDHLQAILRKTERAIDVAFVLIQTGVIAAYSMACVERVVEQDTSKGNHLIWAGLPSLLSGLFVVWKGAKFSEKCKQAPALLSSSRPTDEVIDCDLHYLVDHVRNSSAGFHAMGSRVEQHMTAKLVYVTIVLTMTCMS